MRNTMADRGQPFSPTKRDSKKSQQRKLRLRQRSSTKTAQRGSRSSRDAFVDENESLFLNFQNEVPQPQLGEQQPRRPSAIQDLRPSSTSIATYAANEVPQPHLGEQQPRRPSAIQDLRPSSTSIATYAAGSVWPHLRDMSSGPSHVSHSFPETIDRLKRRDRSLTAINLKV